MNWGSSLLFNVFSWDSWQEGFSNIAYELWSLIPHLLYNLWRLLAWVVNAVEGIFRNLAGIGSTGGDMVSEIINNSKVQAIFGNMVGLATAVIVFFTIVKIIQEHYKEKDGGNPYKIVLRTFKGLLMFFFVNGAVTVGLYASQVMFKALDAATGSGSASIAGLVFKSMASDANRLVHGEWQDGPLVPIMNKYVKRIKNEGNDAGNYFMVEISDKGKAKSKASIQALREESFPIYQWEISEGDSEKWIDLANYLGTADFTSEFHNGYTDDENEDTNVSGSVGYQSDLLLGVDMSVVPSIDLVYSPIDIDMLYYNLVQENKIEHNVQVMALGSGVLIPMSTQFLKFGKPEVVEKPLEESAKQFGIAVGGNMALQDGAACASYNLDMGELFSKKFKQIFQSLIMNVYYTNLVCRMLQIIPPFPGETSIGPVAINYVQMLAPMISKIFEYTIANAFQESIPYEWIDKSTGEPTDNPTNAEKVYMVEVFSNGATSHNAGVWVTMNTSSKFLDTVVEQYRIDGNFTDLWGQLMNNWAALKEQIETENSTAYDAAMVDINGIEEISDRIGEQDGWQTYMGKVNSYNDSAAGDLTRLGNLLALWDGLMSANTGVTGGGISTRDYLQNQGYSGDQASLEDDIRSIFVSLVGNYNAMVHNQKPTNCYADPRLTMPVYKPIVEFHLSDKAAEDISKSIPKIKAVMTNNASDKSTYGAAAGDTIVNMVIDDAKAINKGAADAKSAYRIVDWSAYGPAYKNDADLRDCSDVIYFESDANPNWKDIKEILVNDSYSKLAYMSLLEQPEEGWEGQGGIRYFLRDTNTDNDFRNQSTTADLQKYVNSFKHGCWTNKGILICDRPYNPHPETAANPNPVYYYYEGTVRSMNNEFAKLSTNLNRVSLTSTANQNLIASALKDEYAKTTKQLFTTSSTSTSTTNQSEFERQIITLRPKNGIGTASNLNDVGDGNAKALKKWCKEDYTVKPNGEANVTMLYSMKNNPTEIDNLMASNNGEERRYLLLTKGVDAATNDGKNWGSYIGRMSWNDGDTVEALYYFGDMNFLVGFMAIIAAAGVYLNFAFGLIQRAVNMAVLYIMSPVAISFYPFDDGAKFSNNFVKPFYQEAISAFAVIVSLNLFIVLMTPMQTAFRAATGVWGALDWLVLIAFVSMLPQIRDTVSSILGGGKLQQKSLADTWKAATGTLSQPFKDIANAKKTVSETGKGLAHGADTLRGAVNRVRGKKMATGDEIARLEKAKEANGGKLGWWGQHRLNKLKNAQKSQQRIDEARTAFEAAGDNQEARAAALKNLSKSEQKRLKRQNNAAVAQAKANLKRSDYASDAEYQAALKHEQTRLLGDANFKKSVNGVVASKIKGASRLGRKALHTASHWGPMMDARELGHKLRNTVAGELVAGKYGKYGTLAQNKDSLIGAIWRAKDTDLNLKEQSAAGIQYRDRQKKRNATSKAAVEAFTKASAADAKADAEIDKAARIAAAEEVAKSTRYSIFQKATDLKTEELISSGMDAELAKKKAKDFVNDKKINVAEEYKKMGGDKALAAGMAKGLATFDCKLDMTDASVQEAVKKAKDNIRAKMKLSGDELKAEIQKAKNNRLADTKTHSDLMAVQLGIKGDATKEKILLDILKNADSTTSLTAMTADIASKLGLEKDKINIDASYNSFARDVLSDTEVQQWQAAQNAVKFNAEAQNILKGKFGDDVDWSEVMTTYANYRNSNDSNLDSVNENSLGYKKNQIILKYADQGGLNNAECQAEIKRLTQQMWGESTILFEDFVKHNDRAIREYDQMKKTAEEIKTSYTNQMFDAVQQNREYIMGVKMDMYSQDVLLRDSQIRAMRTSGDYAGAGAKLQMLINAVRQHDDAKIASLGFDAATVEKYKQWEAEGDPNGRLAGTYELAVFDASNMNNIGDMGGSSMLGMQTAFAELTSIAEHKAYAETMKRAASAASSEEGQARTTVAHIRGRLASEFKGDEWNELLKDSTLTNANGEVIRNGADLVNSLQAMVDNINNKGNQHLDDEWFVNNRKALADFRTKYIHNPEYKQMIDSIEDFENAITQAQFANKKSADYNEIMNKINIETALMQDIIQNKMKDERKG